MVHPESEKVIGGHKLAPYQVSPHLPISTDLTPQSSPPFYNESIAADSNLSSGGQHFAMTTLEAVTLKYDGAVYTGQVMKHGFGTEIDRFGNCYEGQWSSDERSGQGKMRFIDGSTYEGSWKAAKFHGIGTLTVGATSMYTITSKEGVKLSGGADDGKEQEEISMIFKAQLESDKYSESHKQAFSLFRDAL